MDLHIELTSDAEQRVRRLMRRFNVRTEEELIGWALGLLDVASEYAHDDRMITVVEPEAMGEIDPGTVVDLQFGRAA